MQNFLIAPSRDKEDKLPTTGRFLRHLYAVVAVTSFIKSPKSVHVSLFLSLAIHRKNYTRFYNIFSHYARFWLTRKDIKHTYWICGAGNRNSISKRRTTGLSKKSN